MIALARVMNRVVSIFIHFAAKMEKTMTKKKVATAPGYHNTDYYQLARELIKQLRGEVGQRDLSTRLGFTFNQVGKWESGVTQIKWNDFIDVVRSLGIDYEKKLKKFFGNYDGEYDFKCIYHYLDHYFGLESVTDPLVLRLRKKWKNKSNSADLGEILKIFDTRPAMLIGFLSFFIDCAQIDQLKEKYKYFLQAMDILCDDPLIGNITEALKVEDYLKLSEHDDTILAIHSGCSVEELKLTLKKHRKLGTIFFDGKKYLPTHLNFSFSSLNVRKLRRFNKFCFEFLAKHYPVTPKETGWDYVYNAGATSNRVVTLSKEAAQEVSQLMSKFHSEVSEIVENDRQPKTNVQLINLASVPVSVGANSEE